MKDSISFILVLLALHPSVAQKIQNLDDFPELEKVIHSAVTKLEHREREDRSILVFKHGGKILSPGGLSKFEKPVSLDRLKNIRMENPMVVTYIGGKMEGKQRKRTSMMEYPMGFGKAGIQMVRNNWNNRWRMENYTALRLGGIQMVRKKMNLCIRMAELSRSWSGNRMGRSVQIPN